ncbi:MAG: hypothetical protein J6M44_08710 [Butyrivibrio sp.]|nr:hypothetical protein [Butyrivibrio sp.]
MIKGIDVPIYQRSISFLVECTLEEFEEFYYLNATRITDEERKQIEEDFKDDQVRGTTWILDSGLYLVFLKDGRSDIDVPHEIFHVCNKILCAAGVNHDADAEPWAYLIGWLTNEYYRMYWDWADSKKKEK